MKREWKRKTVHIAMAGFALLIGRLDSWLIVSCCGLAFLFNMFLLPKLTGRGLERPQDRDRGFPLGILMYPAVLLALSLLFLERQVFLALAWGLMAFGDGLAGLCGKAFGGPRISWNPDKTWTGVLAFIIGGSLLTWLLLLGLPESSRLGLSLLNWAWIVVGAAVAAALVETVRGTIDDNLVVPLTAALTASFLVDVGGIPGWPETWQWGLGLVILLTVFSIGSRKIDIPGGLVGGVLAFAIFLGGGLPGLGLLFAFFVLGTAASQWRRKDKGKLGLAQENRGKRSVRHAVSNGGVAAACGLYAWFHPEHAALFQGMLAASLASATADTLSSELGNLYGRRYVNILTLEREPRGLDGVISLEGSLLGAAGGLLIAAIYGFSHGLLGSAVLVALAGISGNLMDSVLGASLQRSGYMTNDTVNFANTLFAALFFGLIPMLASGMTALPI